MKVFPTTTHCSSVGVSAVAAPLAAQPERSLDFSDIYERHFHEVERWIRALGGPETDLEDLAQEVFLVVRRKLDRFDGRNLRAWLYRISARTVSDHRRRAWFRNLILRQREVDVDALAAPVRSPAEVLEQKETHRLVYRILGRMSEKRRAAFVLFEIEGLSGHEIAALLEVPVATVWTRLHHARRDFVRAVRDQEKP